MNAGERKGNKWTQRRISKRAIADDEGVRGTNLPKANKEEEEEEEKEEEKEEGEEGEAANLEEMPSFPPVVNIGVSNNI